MTKKNKYFSTQYIMKGLLFGIPIGMALSLCGFSMTMDYKGILYATALYCLFAIADWHVRTKNMKKMEDADL